jgi:hypothetical protein
LKIWKDKKEEKQNSSLSFFEQWALDQILYLMLISKLSLNCHANVFQGASLAVCFALEVSLCGS